MTSNLLEEQSMLIEHKALLMSRVNVITMQLKAHVQLQYGTNQNVFDC